MSGTLEGTTPEAPLTAEDLSAPTRLVRAATAMLTTQDSDSPIDEAIKDVAAALRSDTRVLDVMMPIKASPFADWTRVFPYASQSSRETVLTGDDGLFALNMARPIVFEVRVPIKNQPTHHDNDDIPTDTYSVTWDGITVIVAWEQATGSVPLSGGHIVLDVIEAAASLAGFGLYRQGCSPGCEYSFMHTTLKVLGDESCEPGELELVNDGDPEHLVAHADPDMRLTETVMELWFKLGIAGVEFARLKSLGQRVLDLDELSRRDIAHLLGHYYIAARFRVMPWYRSIGHRWQNRHWKREARELMAALWLTITNIETLEREWDEAVRNLESGFDAVQPLFRPEYEGDIRRIRQIDTSTVAAAINQVASGLDNSALAAATALGALGGAVAGAVASQF